MSFPLNQLKERAVALERSPEFIKEIISYANLLQNRNYPVIFSLEHLSMLMGIQSNFLRDLVNTNVDEFQFEYRQSRYKYFKLKKKNGGFREIMTPSKDLKYIQKWILVNILKYYPFSDSCTGFRKGISIKDNALPHQNSNLILKVDLLSFYDTINEQRVFGVFHKMGFAKNLAVNLARITTAHHREHYWSNLDKKLPQKFLCYCRSNPSVLPQGAPTSPALANIVASRLDRRLEALSEKLNFRYTRYADDLTFSIQEKGQLPGLKLIREIIEDEGFFLNEKKTVYMRNGTKQYVTGLTTTNGINLSKRYRKEIGAHIYYCRKFGVLNHIKRNKKDDAMPPKIMAFHDWLYGHVCYIYSINQIAGVKLLADFNKIDWVL